jgi:hypothetical protein
MAATWDDVGRLLAAVEGALTNHRAWINPVHIAEIPPVPLPVTVTNGSRWCRVYLSREALENVSDPGVVRIVAEVAKHRLSLPLPHAPGREMP